MKILITGANGFIGRYLFDHFFREGLRVYGLDLRFPDARRENFIQQDITEPFELTERFDLVFHLAAHNVTHVGQKDDDLYERVNVDGTRHVLRGVKADNFIFLSTHKVYRPEGRLIVEESFLEPAAMYEQSKLAAEKACAEIFSGRKLCILRSVNIVGPGQSEKAVIPVLFKKAVNGEPLEIFGPRKLRLQFLAVEDVGRAFSLLIKKGGLSGTFNLASRDNITLEDLALTIKQLTNSRSEVRFSNESEVPFCEIAGERLERALNWRPEAGIREILEKYARGMLKSQAR